jgi:hypothetical protein
MTLQIATPDDYTGATDDIKVRAAIADTSQPVVAFHARMHQLSDPTPIPVRSGLTLLGPGKQCGRGIQMMTGGCAQLFGGNVGGGSGSEIVGFRLVGLDLYGADDAANTADRMFYGLNAKQCAMENCLVWGFTGDAWFIDGADANKNTTRDNRVNGGSSAGAGSCAVYLNDGNSMLTENDYISGYPTLLRSRVSGLKVENITMERAVGGGDAAYMEAGSAVFNGGWVDPTTCGRTIVQVGSPACWIEGIGTRGVYSSNVHIADSSRFAWAYNPT